MKLKHKKGSKLQNGITLIALVITIIVLLILAGVSIATLTGDNGILTKAQTAKTETERASEEEQLKLAAMNAAMNTERKKYTDKNGNTAIIPAGFAPTGIEGEDLINEGLVVVDSDGNEFVWIPVGKVKDNNGNVHEIQLGRYSFQEDGTPYEYDGTLIEENSRDKDNLLNLGNTIAIDIEAFKKSASPVEEGGNGGYYIGRYEAKDGNTANERDDNTSDENKLVIKSNNYVYNWIRQPEAALLARNMYNSNDFISDLMNGYAWDTAIVFIQECSGDINYSKQVSLNSEREYKGTINSKDIKQQDKKCNIWDMASNMIEWITETSTSTSWGPCVCAGGQVGRGDNKNYAAGTKQGLGLEVGYSLYSFRPVLYLK